MERIRESESEREREKEWHLPGRRRDEADMQMAASCEQDTSAASKRAARAARAADV